MALVVGASVGLKWEIEEPDSALAIALVQNEPELLIPDFRLSVASNVLWRQVRRQLFSRDQARDALDLLFALLQPTSTFPMRLHEAAFKIGLAINHPIYDTLYLAFAIAAGADAVVTADAPFARAVRTHPDPAVAAMALPLDEWARARNVRP